MSDSLRGYIDNMLKEVTALQQAVSELRRENRELRDMITNSHHQWWKWQKRMMDDVDETLAASAAYVNPEYLTDQSD